MFYSAAWDKTIGFRDSSPGKNGAQFNLYPRFVQNEDEKSQDVQFTFPGINRYNVGDVVGITIQVEDATSKVINADVDIGMINNRIKYAGQIVEGRINQVESQMVWSTQESHLMLSDMKKQLCKRRRSLNSEAD